MIVGLCRWLAGKLGHTAWRLQAIAGIRERWWQTLERRDRATIRFSSLSFVIGIASFVAYQWEVALGGSTRGALGFVLIFSAACLSVSAFLLTERLGRGRSPNQRLRALRDFYYAMDGLPPTTEVGREIFQRRFEQRLGYWQNAAKEVWRSMAAITQRLESLRGVELDNLHDAIGQISEAEADLRIEQENLKRIRRRLERNILTATSPHLGTDQLRVPENIEGLLISLTSPPKK